MISSLLSVVMVVLHLAATVLIGVVFLQRVTLTRPPIGRFNLQDIAFMMLIIITLPVLYLNLPALAVVTLIGLSFFTILQAMFAPLMPRRWSILAAIGLIALNIGMQRLEHPNGLHPAFIVLNNLMLVVAIAGVCNLYTQSGMRARDVAVFSVALTFFDYVATSLLPLMVDMVNLLATLPFMPIIAWGDGVRGFAIGLGDVLMLTLWTLTAWKGFGRVAGVVAALLGLGTATAILLALWARVITEAVPVMIFLGPLIAVQYLFWHHRLGRERSIVDFYSVIRPTDPARATQVVPTAEQTAAELQRCLRWLRDNLVELQKHHAGQYIAVADGVVLGVGALEGEARRAARQLRPDVLPVVLFVPPNAPQPFGSAEGEQRMPTSSMAAPAAE